jgi:thiamine pyrophosphate-dependent acetolactate synthase large subunit-like protein
MQAIREIVSPQSEELVIKLPRNFLQEKIEVIILPFHQEDREAPGKKERLMKIYNESKGVIPSGYKFDRDEAHNQLIDEKLQIVNPFV